MKGRRPEPPMRMRVVDERDDEPAGGRPESVRLMLAMFVTAVLLELLALILNVVTTVADPAPLLGAAREAAEGAEIDGPLVEASAWGSLIMVSLFYLLVVAVLAGAVVAIHKNGRWADGALRLWTVFAIYFALRGLTVFLVSPAGSDVPVALFLAEGVVQILVGVAAVLGAVFGSRPDTREWITTPEDRT